ncbi:MAG: UDP-N-acetylmuramate:L-alanyl-gamma-D-glutamyl-meso-diaminopimelate ligase [Desulfobacteraceae bacterium]|nr:UDP-N-acetylmuramate:L-alanyl-gamma-D-glutamyl-meso-diaminopimelate ligase [Desulfobacteraceae bacterium]
MNMNKNFIPDNVKKIHLTAICGTGMGALACLLKDMGFEITGSDQKVYPPMSDFLSQKGIKVADGFDKKNIAYGPDLIIVGNAVTKNNPEALEMSDKDICFCSMPQAVSKFVADKKKSILVTGTHGKTTTSSILTWILHEAGLDPCFVIGGILKNFDSNYRFGKGEYIVIEGDEYDTAFFDKGPKFLHYDPAMAVLTGIEFDHADIFNDIDHVKKTFDTFVSGISKNSTLFAFGDDSNVAEMITERDCSIAEYGKHNKAAWRLNSVSVEPPWTYLEVFKQGKAFGIFRTKLMGEHNLLNILPVIAIADSIMISQEVIAQALETFEGVRRRQEVRGQKNRITVMDDFAHHPTAVRETIRAVRPFYPEARLIAVFEPRTNSSMRKVFQSVYPSSFDQADLICIRKPSRLDKIPHDDRFSYEQLVHDLKTRGKNAFHFPDTEMITDFLVENAKPGDIILVMSNGGFDNIHEKLLERL